MWRMRTCTGSMRGLMRACDGYMRRPGVWVSGMTKLMSGFFLILMPLAMAASLTLNMALFLQLRKIGGQGGYL